TTYMQDRLRANRNRLAERAIQFVDLWRGGREGGAYRAALRAALEGRSVRPDRQQEAAELLRRMTASHVSGNAGAAPLFALSCEVALGNYTVTRGIYPHAEAGSQHIRDAFPDADVKVFLCIRSFDRFLESGYVQ